jgi:glutamyl-tRNA reductase
MPQVEALVVSTCNRTEAYLAGPRSLDLPSAFVALHDELWPGSALRYEILLDRVRREEEAVEHLVRVACGLESSIVGDQQILGQLRYAVAAASKAGTLGRWLGTASAIALRAGRRSLITGPPEQPRRGISSAAVDAIADHCTQRGLTQPSVLLLGSGTVGAAVALQLTHRLGMQLCIASRTAVHAAELAARVGAETVAWDVWPSHVAESHVIVCATASRVPVLRRSHLASRSSARGDLLVVDLGLPRNVDPAVGSGTNFLVTLDDLVSNSPEVDLVYREAAVADALAAWHEWRVGLRVDGVVRAVFGDVDTMVAATVAELAGTTAGVPAMERVVRRHVRALLDGHVRRLRQAAQDLDGASSLAQVCSELADFESIDFESKRSREVSS